jgi:excisionase family DNA binding protein
MEARKLVSVARAARELNVSVPVLARMLREGRIPHYAVGLRPRVVVSEVLSAMSRPTTAQVSE